MTEGLWAAIIGVGGTILGTVLGFGLGKIDFGRLQIQIKTDRQSIYSNTDFNDKVTKVFHVERPILISLYNGANKNRVIRDVKLLFLNEKKKEVLSLALTRVYELGVEHPIDDVVGVVNIPPKSGIDIQAKFATGDIDKLAKAKKIYLQYANEKFKLKKRFLWNCDYSNLAVEVPVENGSYTTLLNDEEY